MKSNEIRQAFLSFFKHKEHQIVASAPMVVKNDPSLMFTNAGMNQFKDLFLGNSIIKYPRIANTQKCLRVSGKHNDLEEVGHDTYHHTMFEMLGNWSFGNYFKEEAIAWAWEFLTEIMKIDKSRLYVTIFEGSKEEGIERDTEAYQVWSKYISPDRIIDGNKKDNFWEMGDTGPCGPCSEIHVDIRDEADRKKIDGKTLVNTSNPLVIEIWNNVFIQFNRKSDGSLEKLPAQHVDTGMGFERLCMVVQGVKSNYDTDIFTPILEEISKISGKKYGANEKQDIAMRVIADHIRAISFAISDGQLPSNNKAGYVIRRILRRAVRYAYTFLEQSEPFICKIIPALVKQMGEAFPELISQQKLIIQVITEEENSFLKTLSSGIKILESQSELILKSGSKELAGKNAFELYDTFGFPLDLTELILREKGIGVNLSEFDAEMEQQKNRSRSDAATEAGDWIIIEGSNKSEFIGYDTLVTEVKIIKYRAIQAKGKTLYHIVFDKTPFYAESGGQEGDTGTISYNSEIIQIIDTKKENDLSVHIAEKMPSEVKATFLAIVNESKRMRTARNHSATHLLQQALREVLGTHVEQKGSLVNDEYLRFDFVHFQKMTEEEILSVEKIVNKRIRENISLQEKRSIAIDEALKTGATALFGEKYGELVRLIQFGKSIELCGGTHVSSTGCIGMVKIVSEGAIAAGIRRLEAISGDAVEKYIEQQQIKEKQLKELLKNPQDLKKAIEQLIEQNQEMNHQLDSLKKEKLIQLKQVLISKKVYKGGINLIAEKIEIDSAASMKDLSFQIKQGIDNLVLILAADIQDKPNISVMISDNLVKEKNYHAGNMIKEMAKKIEGGGGGQAFFASAGGKNVAGLNEAIEVGKMMI